MTIRDILDEKRSKILELLNKETALIAYLDLANMFHWEKILKWRFRIEDVISELNAIPSIKRINVYFGLDPKNEIASKGIQKRVQKAGAIYKTKPVKYIRKTIDEALLFKKSTLTLFDDEITVKMNEFIEEINRRGRIIEEPKCNFDVEITMDMMDDVETVTGIILFSGDSDFKAPLERLKVKGKNVYVVGVRGQMAKELFETSDKFINFGILYGGKRNRIAKIPPKAGPREM